MVEKRKVIDFQCILSENKCSLAIFGTEDEVVKTAAEYAVRCQGERIFLSFVKNFIFF